MSAAGLPISREHALELLEGMLRIRRFEEKCAELYSAGKIRGFLHLYVGEEAIAVGAMQSLGPEDTIVSTYREHGHALARGVPMTRLMAEMYGKREGCCRGRGGSMHIFDTSARFYGGNAIVAAGLPLAVGFALASKMSGARTVAACFFGEGAAAEGEFHESLNLAALWKLPVLFLCENNLYAMGTALERSESEIRIAHKAESYKVPSATVDGMDVVAVETAVQEAVASIRADGGPRFLELATYRFRAHSMFDPELYRDKSEVEAWKKRGPIVTFTQRLRELGWLDEGDLESLDDAIEREIETAVDFAEGAADEAVNDLETDVYTPRRGGPSENERRSDRPARLTYREAIREALREALAGDPGVFLMGEDVGRYGGCYAVSKGLLAEFGEERIRDTPLSESGFTGAGIGAALAGMRPIVEVMTVNFSLLCLDQIVNNAATIRHMSGGQCSVPLVIRMATGAGRQLAAQHSHSLENVYAHVPGLRVVAPATVTDARYMLRAALDDPDPVVIFEHVLLYNAEDSLEPGVTRVDIDRAAVRRAGQDVSLITYGGSLPKALAAADRLAERGVSAEVVDLRTLRPLDEPTILASVGKTRRVVIVDEGWRSGSLAAEIATRIVERAFYDLDAPVARVCSKEAPIPYAKHMEQAALPQVEEIVAAVEGLFGDG